ncbi:hypothetical protein ALC56_02579 [Trachymyrmex septentrionalis]|uniref:Uncharacterized protein n=1 Tax=Trachymyrmex septentrionalis TaxID=34720 RepID=A0A195FR66_9HYME|nr:hypothetical protein ALC56_02579 [Trachymyrmex septentrionalis]
MPRRKRQPFDKAVAIRMRVAKILRIRLVALRNFARVALTTTLSGPSRLSTTEIGFLRAVLDSECTNTFKGFDHEMARLKG